MNVVATERPAERVHALDALRAGLVAWIIGGHALLGYSSIGGWAYDEVSETTIATRTETTLAIVIGPTALFLMGTFFLVAGLFTPLSIARHGPRRFLGQRMLRLGVPFLASALLLWPLCLWVAYRASGRRVGYGWLLTGRDRTLDSGALWFAEVLLAFSVAYVLWHVTLGRRIPRTPRRDGFGAGALVLLAAAIALLTFAVRLYFPARDTQIGDLHLWQWPQLGAMFALGIAGARYGMARGVARGLWRTSGWVTFAAIVSIPVVAGLLGVHRLDGDLRVFLGGWYTESLLLAGVEAVLVVFGSVWLLGLAQRVFDGTGRFARAAARSSFAAFVLQGPVLILLAVALRPAPVVAELKAMAVGVLGIAICFGLGWLLVSRTPLRRLL